MTNTNYRVIFNVEGLKGSIYEGIVGLEEIMKEELFRVYNIYADKTNDGVTDKINDEFKKLYPNYFEDNKDKEWYDLHLYNQYIADEYQRLVVDDFNESNISPILDFLVDPEEIVFTGYLKGDKKVKINFYLKEVPEEES